MATAAVAVLGVATWAVRRREAPRPFSRLPSDAETTGDDTDESDAALAADAARAQAAAERAARARARLRRGLDMVRRTVQASALVAYWAEAAPARVWSRHWRFVSLEGLVKERSEGAVKGRLDKLMRSEPFFSHLLDAFLTFCAATGQESAPKAGGARGGSAPKRSDDVWSLAMPLHGWLAFCRGLDLGGVDAAVATALFRRLVRAGQERLHAGQTRRIGALVVVREAGHADAQQALDLADLAEACGEGHGLTLGDCRGARTRSTACMPMCS
jgi:hypothetical protein